MYSTRRPFTDSERERLAASIDTIYADFVAKVASGRGRTVADIEPLARGRVWTGRDAHEIGLVDELGGLRDAARIARRLSGLPDDAPVTPALHLPVLARLGQPRNSEDPRALLAAPLPSLTELGAHIHRAQGLLGTDGIQLRMPDVRLR
jgi:protease-4